jgi:hypothetical protein
MKSSGFGQSFHLNYCYAAVGVCGLSDGEELKREGFFLAGDVSLFICGCSPEEGDIDVDGFVPEPFLSGEVDDFLEIGTFL